MTTFRVAAFTFAAMFFLGGQTWTHGQYRLGRPVTVDNPSNLPTALAPNREGINEKAPIDVVHGPIAHEVRLPNSGGFKEPRIDEFGLTPPTRDQLFRVQSEQALKERFRQELPKLKKVDFPTDAAPLPEVPGSDLAPFAEKSISPIANQVCYRPLYFEDKRTERFGQYVPCVQPLVSAGRFYGSVLFLPCRLWNSPPWTFECDNR